ncbi:AlpA family phage regulatory protein [Paracoccus sp. TK19116]|uniref:AlpA family phage regulatory protein n=1 Tax=Paracoccus albicereus TaxID=2922394 RepID=A0ABT1MT96_9RHOB|nr:AlpA family phage regulatory protein [Paracoccus albicereus]MCQ0971545.1 AlpA family phage regulatory protein [Paracoccus albicereus]
MTQQHITKAEYLSDKQVAARYSLKSREAVWKWSRKGTFPKPISLSPGCTRWKLSDLQTWEAECEAAQ